MTAPTIPPQQPEPERVCGNCEFFLHESRRRDTCNIGPHLPPFLQVDGGAMERNVYEFDTCVLFRARKESMTDNIPPEIADKGSAPAPARISPEVRETILKGLRRFKGDDLERAIHAFGREPKGANANYIDQLKATRAKIERAIAFVEALP